MNLQVPSSLRHASSVDLDIPALAQLVNETRASKARAARNNLLS